MKDINSYKYKKNLVYPINEARNTWGTLRPPSIKRSEYIRTHDYLNLIRTTLTPLTGNHTEVAISSGVSNPRF